MQDSRIDEKRGECRCDGVKVSRCKGKPLCEVKSCGRLKVSGINGGRQVCARMAAMGIYPGAELEMLCSGCGAPCLVRIHGGTLSIGAGISEKILVTAEP